MAKRKARRVLLVEGNDDEQVIYQLCNAHGVDNRSMFIVAAKDGYESLRDDLRVRPKTGVEVVGAVVDADLDLSARWRSLRDALAACGYRELPTEPSREGTVIEARDHLPRVGLWIMPDNHLRGAVEDFLLLLAGDGEALLPHAEAAVDGLRGELRRFKRTYRSKAVIHTWLAWQKEPGTRLGQALTNRYLDPDHALALRFRDWLLALFASPPPERT